MPFVFWEIVIPLIIAFLLGLFFGWLWWGWRRTKITYTQWETMRQKANRASSVEAEAELVELRSENERLQAEIDDHECEVSAGDAELGTGVLGLSGAAALADTDSDADEQSADEQSTDEQSTDEQSADESAATDSTEADAGIEADAGADDASDAAAGESDSDDDEAGDLHPYGDGSHAPIDDAGKDMPEGYPIKGNVDSMLYHRPDSRVYASTGAEVWFDTSQRAEDNGFGLAKSHPKDTVIADADRPVAGERHPYGAGSHAPFTDDPKIMPEGYPIKGNADSMLYHREDSRSYGATIAEVWFDTPESAEAAGFGLANSHPKD